MKQKRLITWGLAAFFATTTFMTSALEIHIAPYGEKDAKGTQDDPLRTLEQARNAVRQRRDKNEPVTVWLHEGDYIREQSFVLIEKDGGTSNAPVVYQARPDANVRLIGGRIVDDWQPVSDPDIRKRLPEAAQDKVMVVDLYATGIEDLGKLKSRGFKRGPGPAALELFFNDEPMTLARWPNKGFVKIMGFPKKYENKNSQGYKMGKLEGGFFYKNKRPETWQQPEKVWMHGFWMHDWADTHERIEQLDTERQHIITAPPRGEYGFKTGQRYYYYNILEELDQPGEWYLDRKSGKLYFWLPSSPKEGETIVSLIEAPLIDLQNVSHVTLRGLHLRGGRSTGIQVANGSHVRIGNCEIKNSGTLGIRLQGGHEYQVRGCTISNAGETGLRVQGGDTDKLTPAKHEIINNHIHGMGRWSYCYRPGIEMRGVGIRLAHNVIHDGPHSAISFRGVNTIIEYNEIHSVCQQSGDVGAIYTGRSWVARDNVIRYNYIHHLDGLGGHGAKAIYLDDMASGMTVFGNIIYKGQDGVYVGGGRDNLIANNLLIDMERNPIYIDARGANKHPHWRNMVHARIKTELFDILEHNPIYAEKFPDLNRIKELYENSEGFIPPAGTKVVGNVIVDNTPLRMPEEEAAQGVVTTKNNLIGIDPLFKDKPPENFRLHPDSPVWDIGFKPIPVKKIGNQ